MAPACDVGRAESHLLAGPASRYARGLDASRPHLLAFGPEPPLEARQQLVVAAVEVHREMYQDIGPQWSKKLQEFLGVWIVVTSTFEHDLMHGLDVIGQFCSPKKPI